MPDMLSIYRRHGDKFLMFGRLSIITMALIGTLSSVTVAHAQACSIDLSALVGQIQNPNLQPLLTEHLDDRIATEGGLEQSIVLAQQRLDSLTAFRNGLGPDDSADVRSSVDQTIVVISARLDALICRRGSP